MATLKYIENLNKIIECIASEPNKVWSKTQRELSLALNLPQPTISTLVKVLKDQGRIAEGASLPGIRGRNRELILIDDMPIQHPLHSQDERAMMPDPRPDEMVQGVIDLKSLSPEVLGLAIARFIQSSIEKENQQSRARLDNQERLREYRARLEEEKRQSAYLSGQNKQLEKKIFDLEATVAELRQKINSTLLVQGNKKANGNGSYSVRELLSNEERTLLNTLLSSSEDGSS